MAREGWIGVSLTTRCWLAPFHRHLLQSADTMVRGKIIIILYTFDFMTGSGMIHMSNHFYLGFTKVVYGMLYLIVYHQYSLVNEIGSPHKQDTFA